MPLDHAIAVCPNSADVRALISGTLPATDAARLWRHVADCTHCRELMRGHEPIADDSSPTGVYQADQVSAGPAKDPTHSELQTSRGTDEIAPPGLPPTLKLESGYDTFSWRSMLAPPREPGELGRLGGYRILRLLGQGGMGIVVEGEDIQLKRRVAIKILRPGEITPSHRQRFLQEAQIAASITSDHVVTIHQVGEDRGCLFIVMELLQGESLEARLERDGWLPVAEALRIAREIAEGLTAAHEKQLVHRDIKSANVWLEKRRGDESAPRAKLLDFGIARSLVEHQNLTLGGHIVGTPSCMSPEQASGQAVDQRSDLFSLGCLLYTMIAGRPPFERDNLVRSLRAVVDEKAEPLTSIVPSLPPKTAKLIERLLEKDPNSRPASARRVAEEIRQLEQSLTTTAMVVGERTGTSLQRAAQLRRKLGWGTWAGIAAIFVALLLGGWAQYRQVVSTARDRTKPTAAVGDKMALAGNTDGAVAADDSKAEQTQNADQAAAPNNLPTIKVGVLHSLTGPMATSERSIVDALLMAFNEINESGGLLGGRLIEPIVRDGKSNELVFAQQAEDLIQREQVVTLFGCWRSPCRKLVEEVCRRHEHLLVYPTTYEGLEDSPYVIYMGGAPNQQVIPAVKWAFAFLGKRKFFLIGGDGVYSHSVHAIIADELEALGGEVVGKGYRPLGDTDFAAIAREVVESGADVVMNTVSGAGNNSLFYQLRNAGVTTENVPVISFKVGEEELQTISANDSQLVGDYAVWSYFQSLTNTDNLDFLDRLTARYGPTRVATDPMVAAYSGVYLWARAVEQVQTDQVAEIRAEMVQQTFDESPEGPLSIDPDNHHACRMALIGQVNHDLQFDIVWTSPKPIAPEPFPPSRSREEWEAFQRGLFEQWGGNWRPDAPAAPDPLPEDPPSDDSPPADKDPS